MLVDLLAVMKYYPLHFTGTSQRIRDITVGSRHLSQFLDSLIVLATANLCLVCYVRESYRYLWRDVSLDLHLERVQPQIVHGTMLNIVHHLAETQTR